MFNMNFADDWIRTADLWYWKQPLYQLSHNHNHFPFLFLCLTFETAWAAPVQHILLSKSSLSWVCTKQEQGQPIFQNYSKTRLNLF